MNEYFAGIVGYEDVKRELNVIRDMIVNTYTCGCSKDNGNVIKKEGMA